ncbi:MAG: hypothetical protein AAF485_12995 [Chloroflexota bacterium]
MDFLGPISLFLGSLVLIFLLAIGSKYANENKRSAWKALTQQHPGLTFHAASEEKSIQASYVSGTYKAYDLTLKTIVNHSGNKNQIYTVIEISAPREALPDPENVARPTARLKPGDIIDMLFAGEAQQALSLTNIIFVSDSGRSAIYREKEIQTQIALLQSRFDTMIDLMQRYPQVLALGGDAVPGLLALHGYDGVIFQRISENLLYDIGSHTRKRLAWKLTRLLCPYCLTRPDKLAAKISWTETMTYYGCRSCGQSNHFLKGERTIALLDAGISEKVTETTDEIRINWLVERTLFDFDAVQIDNATDEDVERFLVQMGNDTDEWRVKRYPQVSCMVASTCDLSINTQRLLERQFKEVRWE